MISIDEFMQSMIEQYQKQQRRGKGKHSQEELIAQFKMFDKVRKAPSEQLFDENSNIIIEW